MKISNLEVIDISMPPRTEVVLGQGTFNLFTIEDLHRAVAIGAPNGECGIAFTEASDERLIRHAGNNTNLAQLACDNLLTIGCGHTFLIFLQKSFPIQILQSLKSLPTIIRVLAATGNSLKLVIARTDDGHSSILGVIDGDPPTRAENVLEKHARQTLIRRIGYLESWCEDGS